MVPVTARVATDTVQLGRIDALLPSVSYRKAQRRTLILNGFVGVLYVGLGLLRVWFSGGARPGLSYFYIALGLCYVFMVATLSWLRRVPARHVGVAADSDVTISNTGLSFVPSGRALPWKKIVEIRNVGDHFAFVSRNGVSYAAIPTSALANDGRDLWLALDDLLVSKRYLIRPSATTERIIVGPRATAKAP